jgi:heterodisulfide reductase subunit B
MKLAYYPGCVSRSTGKEYDLSTRAVCGALGVELEELEDWNCCGATHCSNEILMAGLAARNLAQTALPVMASCSICYSNLRLGIKKLEDKTLLEKVNAVLERKYQGGEAKHILKVLVERFREDKVTIPLEGVKVAPYYGCLLTRPKDGIDSPENPSLLERFIAMLKAEPVGYPYKMLCCGGPIFMPQEEAAEESAFRILQSAKKAGAEILVTVCPLCHLMLDSKQQSLEMKHKASVGMPVLYITQLAGIALGLGPEELGLDRNSVSPMAVVDGIYQRMAEKK